MSWLRRALTGGDGAPVDQGRLAALETHTRALYDEAAQLRQEQRTFEHQLQQLRQDEARRAAEHATMVDSLSRLYKRISARIDRDHQLAVQAQEASTDQGESVGALRRRLGR